MTWLVNLIFGAFRLAVALARVAIPVVAALIIFGFVYNFMWSLVAGAYLGGFAAFIVAAWLAVMAGNGLAGALWR